MFKQLPSSTAALYLQHQQSQWQRLCGTLISHWTTVDRLTYSSHKNILSAHRKNHALWCGCFFKREHVFPVFFHIKPSPPERLPHYSTSWECTITAKLPGQQAQALGAAMSQTEKGKYPGCHYRFDHHTWTGSMILLPSKWGWEPGFCQVHCMRGGCCSATLQDWGIPSKKHLPHLTSFRVIHTTGHRKKVMHLPFCSSSSALLLCPKTLGRDKS